ncbi:hypothetical protein Agub_g15776 [Astrephomene gubernaculifera]|uniref:Uncharacterized protein n=1 Tax=Astrephomene gubernaculifera TaxID=47775 RepID=A0AAD3E5N9_9CHLO|nr:hypothetical protein Agub_g15776 [Astrephomene gubernaculifera]
MAHTLSSGPPSSINNLRHVVLQHQLKPCQPPVPWRNCNHVQSECSTSYHLDPTQLPRGWRIRSHAARKARNQPEPEQTVEPEPAPARRRTRKTKTPPPPPPQDYEDEGEELPEPSMTAVAPEQGKRGPSSKPTTTAAAKAAKSQQSEEDELSGVAVMDGDNEGGVVQEDPARPQIEIDRDLYDKLDDAMHGEPSTWMDLPMRMVPSNEEDQQRLEQVIQMETYFGRIWEHEEVDDLAFFEAEKMRDKAHNIYANTHRVARMMHVLEAEDFRMGEKQTHWSSWARAELLFSTHYDEFNEAVKANMDSIVRQPLDEELRERLEAIGEASLLPPTEAEVAQMAEAEAANTPAALRTMSREDVARRAATSLLEGILPGVSLANPMERYAEDIYDGEGGGEEATDELFSMMGEGADGEGDEEGAGAE